MIKLSSDQFIFVLPLASERAGAEEKAVLKNGIPLSNSQIEDAERAGAYIGKGEKTNKKIISGK
ncbi:MAG: hypothetical protein WB792_13500 [Desulfobacterales bacterium]